MIAIVRPAGVLYCKHRLSEQSTGTSILASRASSPHFPAAACSRPPSDHALAAHIFGSAPCHTQNMHANSARSVSHHVRREHVPYQTSTSVVHQEAFPLLYGENTFCTRPLRPWFTKKHSHSCMARTRSTSHLYVRGSPRIIPSLVRREHVLYQPFAKLNAQERFSAAYISRTYVNRAPF